MRLILSSIAAFTLMLTGAPAALAQPASLKVEEIKVHSRSIEGNLEGNSADRDVFVVLPPSYGKDPARRYPVVYFLHGFFASAEKYMAGTKIAEGAAVALEATGKEMIIVVPDADSRHAGSLYSNSPTVGDFEGFIARDLVSAIDKRYRTLAKPESRGLSGHSMGGYGTLRIAMNHPGVFSSIYAMSACCLAPRVPVAGEMKPLETMTPDEAAKGNFMVRATLATAAAWSPAPEKKPFFIETGLKPDGTIDPIVSAKWAANAPLIMVAQHIPALKGLKAIAMDVGDKDSLLASNEAVHVELQRFGIQHSWQVYDGDHGNRITERFRTKLLPFFAEQLSARQDRASYWPID